VTFVASAKKVKPYKSQLSKWTNLGHYQKWQISDIYIATPANSQQWAKPQVSLILLIKLKTLIQLLRCLDQRFSTQITPRPVFYHNLGCKRKAILFGSLFGQFYLPPSNKKGLKVFKNEYIWVDIIFFCKI